MKELKISTVFSKIRIFICIKSGSLRRRDHLVPPRFSSPERRSTESFVILTPASQLVEEKCELKGDIRKLASGWPSPGGIC